MVDDLKSVDASSFNVVNDELREKGFSEEDMVADLVKLLMDGLVFEQGDSGLVVLSVGLTADISAERPASGDTEGALDTGGAPGGDFTAEVLAPLTGRGIPDMDVEGLEVCVSLGALYCAMMLLSLVTLSLLLLHLSLHVLSLTSFGKTLS